MNVILGDLDSSDDFDKARYLIMQTIMREGMKEGDGAYSIVGLPAPVLMYWLEEISAGREAKRKAITAAELEKLNLVNRYSELLMNAGAMVEGLLTEEKFKEWFEGSKFSKKGKGGGYGW